MYHIRGRERGERENEKMMMNVKVNKHTNIPDLMCLPKQSFNALSQLPGIVGLK